MLHPTGRVTVARTLAYHVFYGFGIHVISWTSTYGPDRFRSRMLQRAERRERDAADYRTADSNRALLDVRYRTDPARTERYWSMVDRYDRRADAHLAWDFGRC